MEINPQKPPELIRREQAVRRNSVPPKESASQEKPGVSNRFSTSANKLEKALSSSPEIRPEKVQEGRELIKNSGYPSDEDRAELVNLFLREIF